MGTLYTIRSSASAMPEESFLQELTDIVAASGVKNLSTTGHLKVVQRGAGANLSVDFQTGNAFIMCPNSGNTYPVRHTGSVTNQAVTSNNSGQTRIDAAVVYIDLAVDATGNPGDNVAKFKIVAGTAGSGSAPSDSDIQTSVGANNGFLRCANITVANGAAQILNANITDTRTRFKLRSQIVYGTASDAATTTYDVSDANFITHVLGGNRTCAVIGDDVGVPFTIRFVQPPAGGPYTPTLWSNIDWQGDSLTFSTTANAADTVAFVKKSNGHYDAYIMGIGGTA